MSSPEPAAFRVMTDVKGRVALAVGPQWVASAARELERRGIDRLHVTYRNGFQGDNLDFLDGLRIRELFVLDRSLRDVSGISALADTLDELYLEVHPDAELDLEHVPNIRRLEASWPAVGDSLSELRQLEELSTWEYDSPDLVLLSRHSTLASLSISRAPCLMSLEGLDQLLHLRHLTITSARELADISQLEAAVALERLRFERCPEIRTLNPMRGLVRLTHLDVSDGGRIATLAPISGLKQLRAFYAWGSTRIDDDDLTPLQQLPLLRDLRMRSRRSYRPSLEAVQRSLGA